MKNMIWKYKKVKKLSVVYTSILCLGELSGTKMNAYKLPKQASEKWRFSWFLPFFLVGVLLCVGILCSYASSYTPYLQIHFLFWKNIDFSLILSLLNIKNSQYQGILLKEISGYWLFLTFRRLNISEKSIFFQNKKLPFW